MPEGNPRKKPRRSFKYTPTIMRHVRDMIAAGQPMGEVAQNLAEMYKGLHRRNAYEYIRTHFAGRDPNAAYKEWFANRKKPRKEGYFKWTPEIMLDIANRLGEGATKKQVHADLLAENPELSPSYAMKVMTRHFPQHLDPHEAYLKWEERMLEREAQLEAKRKKFKHQWDSMSPEERLSALQNLRDAHEAYLAGRTEEDIKKHKQHTSEGAKRHWDSLTPKQRWKATKHLRRYWADISPKEARKVFDKLAKAIKKHRAGMSDKERAEWGEAISRGRRMKYGTRNKIIREAAEDRGRFPSREFPRGEERSAGRPVYEQRKSKRRRQNEAIMAAMEDLTEQERDIITRKFGFMTGISLDDEELGL